MRKIGKILESRGKISKISLTDKDIFYIFRRVIKEEFGNVGAENLQGDYFKKKTIFVKTKNPAWGSELILNQKRIITQINGELGEEAIKELKIR